MVWYVALVAIMLILAMHLFLLYLHQRRIAKLEAKHEKAIIEMSQDILTITGCPTRDHLERQKTNVHCTGYFWTAHTDYAKSGQLVDLTSMSYTMFVRRIHQGLITRIPPDSQNSKNDE